MFMLVQRAQSDEVISQKYLSPQVGDVVTVGECRPLSKTVKFNTLKVTKAQGNKKAFKKF